MQNEHPPKLRKNPFFAATDKMSGIAAAIYGVYAVTTALTGAVSDRWIARGGSPTRVRKEFLLASAIGVTVTIACSAYVEPRAAVWLLGATGVFFGLSTPTMFAVTSTLAGPRAAGRWAGAQNLAGQLAGILAPMLTGFLIDRSHRGLLLGVHCLRGVGNRGDNGVGLRYSTDSAGGVAGRTGESTSRGCTARLAPVSRQAHLLPGARQSGS